MKMSENLWLSDVFRGMEMEHGPEIGLISVDIKLLDYKKSALE